MTSKKQNHLYRFNYPPERLTYLTLFLHTIFLMCLAIPGRIVEISNDKQHATVDYGDGTMRRINVSLVDVKKDDYVLVHAGFAIETLDKKEAEETLELFNQMLNS